MKYIFNRKTFLNSINELLKDEITDKQKERVTEVWGEPYLDYETITSTDRIQKGKWELSLEDSQMVISKLFNTDIKKVKSLLNSIPKEFEDALKLSLVKDNLPYRLEKSFDEDWSLKTLTAKQITAFSSSIFRGINVGETKSDKIISRDYDGRPKMGEDGKPIKLDKEPGELVLSKNMSNINTFVSDWNKTYPDNKIDKDIFSDNNFQNIANIFVGHESIIDFKVLADRKVHLYISDKPEDILNMSVSPFYQSCQELYSGGGHGTQYMYQLLSNVFDPNSVPAFLIIDTPYISANDGSELSSVVSLSRTVIRNIEDSYTGEDLGLYFDKVYPSERMSEITKEMIEKYSDNQRSDKNFNYYVFKPAVDFCDIGETKPGARKSLGKPYMDTLNIKHRKVMNVNVKKVVLKGDMEINLNIGDKVKEIVIETADLPEDFFDLNLDIELLKIRYLKIKTLAEFRKIITDNIMFEKCYIGNSVWSAMLRNLKDLKRIIIKSIDTNKRVSPIEFGRMEKLEELELIYSFKDLNPNLLESNSLKKLTISGDMLMSDKNKYIIDQLKKKGVEIKTIGLVL